MPGLLTPWRGSLTRGLRKEPKLYFYDWAAVPDPAARFENLVAVHLLRVGLAGVRRSGKTFLFFDAIQRLAARGVDRRRIVYLNFEDDRLHPIRAEELDLVLRSWLEVFPLSFREYLKFRGIEVVPHDAGNESLLRHELEAFLLCGGFPEIVLAEEALRPLILEEYSSLMLYRDVVERYGVRNEKLMRELLRHCFRNTGSLLNVSKLHRDFTSLGYTVSKNTLFDYLGYLEDAFLVFLLPKRETSIRKQAHNPKKLHVIDTGLIAAFQAFPSRDPSHKLETLVFLENRRRRKELFYYANGSEVDLCDAEGKLFVNTCWNLADADTFHREKAAMAFGATRWPEAEGTLIYHEYVPGREREVPGAQAAWRYLLRP